LRAFLAPERTVLRVVDHHAYKEPEIMSDTFNIGIVGCGAISNAYVKGCRLFRHLEITACADINPEAAAAKAAEHGLRACSVEDLVNDPAIDAVLNLTIPKAHAEVALQALEAGKHVYSEKPLAVTFEDGCRIRDTAQTRGLRVGCAPDTFLGAGMQTCRKLLDDNWLGNVHGGMAVLMSRGPESWHPNPMFFYETGGGPVFDMGPYYITALVHLLGPVAGVSAVCGKTFAERTATCEAHFGRKLPVEIPTHNTGLLTFQSGAVVSVMLSFDVWRHGHHPIELYGTGGSLQVPDPNTFGGPVRVFRPQQGEWQDVPLTHGYRENSRGIGLADMAAAIRDDRPHRCSGDLALHVLEVMHAFEQASDAGRQVALTTTCEQPAAFPLDLLAGILD